MAWSTPSTRSTGDLITAAIWNQDVVNNAIALTAAGWTFFFSGGGSEIPDDTKLWVEVPFKCDIDRVTLLADQSGDIQIDLWVEVYANYPPTVANTITAAAVPAISADTDSQDSTLTGWTPAISAGAIMVGNVDSCTTITACACALKVSRS